ncbi:hypothetical protein SK128_004646, partial [Halocaridina rubra]
MALKISPRTAKGIFSSPKLFWDEDSVASSLVLQSLSFSENDKYTIRCVESETKQSLTQLMFQYEPRCPFQRFRRNYRPNFSRDRGNI